jgi:hypothetical protein
MSPRPFRLTPPEPLELDIHQTCAQALDRLLLPPAVWACYPAGIIKLTGAQMARYAALGLKRGWPDLLIGFDGVWGIELKRRGGKLSKTRIGRTRSGAPRILEGQEDVFPMLLASGMFRAIGVAYSVEDMLGQLAIWGIPLRPYHIGPPRMSSAAIGPIASQSGHKGF